VFTSRSSSPAASLTPVEVRRSVAAADTTDAQHLVTVAQLEDLAVLWVVHSRQHLGRGLRVEPDDGGEQFDARWVEHTHLVLAGKEGGDADVGEGSAADDAVRPELVLADPLVARLRARTGSCRAE
jgi:hypothetical protein